MDHQSKYRSSQLLRLLLRNSCLGDEISKQTWIWFLCLLLDGLRGKCHIVLPNVPGCDIVASEFELATRYYVHSWTNTIEKGFGLVAFWHTDLCGSFNFVYTYSISLSLSLSLYIYIYIYIYILTTSNPNRKVGFIEKLSRHYSVSVLLNHHQDYEGLY